MELEIFIFCLFSGFFMFSYKVHKTLKAVKSNYI